MRKIAALFAMFVSILLIVPCFAYSPPPVTNGLVGCWKFDEGSGTTAVDSSGSGNNGLIVNAAYSTDTPSQALSTSALEFNNTWDKTPAYVRIPDNSSLRPSSGLTLAAWVKAGTYEARMRTVIGKQWGAGASDSYVLWYHDDGNLWFDVGGVGHISTARPSANEWHYIVGTFNGSFMRLYVDGVEKVNSTGTGTIPYDDNPVVIGADSNNAAHTTDSGWNGTIDEVLIYNRALSQSEIMQVIPEFPPVLTLPFLMITTMIGILVYSWRPRKRPTLSFS